MAYNTYNKYRIHAENGLTSGVNQNLETNEEYIADTERDNGCAANTVIKKNLINTGLRESTLFAASFADLLCSGTREFTPNETIENTSAYILAGLKARLLEDANNASFGSVHVDDDLFVNYIDGGGNQIYVTGNTTVDGSLDVTGVVNLGNTLTVAGLISGSNINVTNSTFDSIMPKTANSNVGSSSSKFANVYSKNVDTETITASAEVSTPKLTSTGNISLYKDILPDTTSSRSLGSTSLKFKQIYATNFYGALTGNVTGNVTGNASTATKLNGTSIGSTKNAIYFSNGLPVASSWNETLYNRLESEATFQNVVTSNPNASSFNVYIPSASSNSKVYMNMFALIDFSGDKCSVNFVANSPTTSSPNTYSNHIVAYNVVYRLVVNGPWTSGSSARYSITLQYNSNKTASDSDSGWSNVGSEYVQSIVVHYTVR